MPDYFRVAYVRNLGPGGPSWPEKIVEIRHWTWQRSALVRWTLLHPTNAEELRAAVVDLGSAGLVVLDWPVDASPDAENALSKIREAHPVLKVLAVHRGTGDDLRWDAIVSGTGTLPGRVKDQHVHGLLEQEISRRGIEAAFRALGVHLPPVALQLDIEDRELAVAELRDWLGAERLRLYIQIFFPMATTVQVRSVGGGWSGARLCKLHVEGDDHPYFIKFTDNQGEYAKEFTNHNRAQAWLERAIMNLKLVPDLGNSFDDQRQPFADPRNAFFPVCYESASTRQAPRAMFRDLYRVQNQQFLEQVTVRLIEILGTRQPGLDHRPSCAPWNCIEGAPFSVPKRMERDAIATMEDLEGYGPPLCQNSEAEWEQLCMRIKALFGGRLPSWLRDHLPVVIGHTHGDPNPRNCLVLPNHGLDVRLIDCGDYDANGRLVSDLAIVERDVKLVLLGIEKEADGFFDLDVRRMPDWCNAEHEAIGRLLDYTPEHAPTGPSVKRAYRLIGLVRQKAKELSGEWDPGGKHYFAMLLFWTLDALKYKLAVRPTKKLLALYSASEILRKFGT